MTKIRTTAVLAENVPVTTTPVLFPHIVDGGGYTTQVILFSPTPGQAGLGSVQFVAQSGQALTLTYE